MATSVSIVLVSWNSRQWMGRCLEALPADAEVIVVDNASTDGTPDEIAANFPRYRLLRQTTNLGFAGGINVGTVAATGAYLLLLNIDAEPTPRAIERLTTYLDEHAECGAAAGRLLDYQEERQVGVDVRRLPTLTSLALDLLLISRIWPTNPVTRRQLALDIDTNEPVPIEQPAVVCLMVRRTAFESVGRMDDAFYPAWFEDVDLCHRLRNAGWQIVFVPQAAFRHHGGGAMRALGLERFSVVWHRNLERYVRKHHNMLAFALVKLLVVQGMLLRLLVSAFKADREALSAYGAVLTGSLTNWRRETQTLRP